MTSTDVKIKEVITEEDKIGVIETVVDAVIGVGEDGAAYYRPYCRERGMLAGFRRYLLENSADHALSDADASKLLCSFQKAFAEELSSIEQMIDDIIRFKKNCFSHIPPALLRNLMEISEKQRQTEEEKLQAAKKKNYLLQQQIKLCSYAENAVEMLSSEQAQADAGA